MGGENDGDVGDSDSALSSLRVRNGMSRVNGGRPNGEVGREVTCTAGGGGGGGTGGIYTFGTSVTAGAGGGPVDTVTVCCRCSRVWVSRSDLTVLSGATLLGRTP